MTTMMGYSVRSDDKKKKEKKEQVKTTSQRGKEGNAKKNAPANKMINETR